MPWSILDAAPVASGAFAPVDASYVVLGLNATLTDERVLTAGVGIALVDAGAGSTITVSATSDAGPWDETGTVVHLDTATNTVAIGVAAMSGTEKVRVVGAAGDMGILSEVTGTGAAFVPAFQGLAAHTGTGQFIGLFVSGTLAQTGGAFAGSIVRSTLNVGSTSAAWTWTGFHCNSQITGAAGTATQWSSFHNQTGKTGAGTVTDMIGYLSAPSGGGGTVTRYYGFFTEAFALPTTEIGGFFQGASAAIEVGTGTPAARTTNGVWFEDGDMVLNGTAMAGTEILRVVGDAAVEGVSAAVSFALTDPAAGTALFIESDDGGGAGLSGAATGRIRYDDGAAAWQISVQTGAYVDILTAAVGSTAFIQDGNSFGVLGTLGTNDAFGLAFETNTVERARFVSTGECVFGGTTTFNSDFLIQIRTNVNDRRGEFIENISAGNIAKASLHMNSNNTTFECGATSSGFGTVLGLGASQAFVRNNISGGTFNIVQVGLGVIRFTVNSGERMRVTSAGGTNTLQGNGSLIIQGGAGAADILTLSSTVNATKGTIRFGTSAYDEVNNRLGVGTFSPGAKLHVVESVAGTAELLVLENSAVATVGNIVQMNFQLKDDGPGDTDYARMEVQSTAVTAGTQVGVFRLSLQDGAGALTELMRLLGGTGLRIEPGGIAADPAFALQVIGATVSTTVDATTDFTVGATVITDGVITDAGGLQIAAALDMANNTISNVGAATNDWTATGITTAGSVAVGVAGSDQGTLTLAGVTSGVVTVAVAAAAGTWTMTLPTGVAAVGGEQLTDAAGNGVTSWAAAASNRESKNISGEASPQDALGLMLNTKAYRFHYKEGHGTKDYKTEYVGPVAEEAPWAMHYGRRIVNPVNTLGYMLLGFQAQGAQLDENRTEIQRLKDRIAALEAA